MSREIRRVPVDWQHPTEPNPHWVHQVSWKLNRDGNMSRLHMPQVRFRPLWTDYAGSLADFQRCPDDYDGYAPDPEDYFPDFGDLELGYCLYETVSEGTPITPVFTTAEELIEHLCTEGDDWSQTPWRREAAEQMVGLGFSLGSFFVSNGQVLDGARDIDKAPRSAS